MESLTDRIIRHEGFCSFPKSDSQFKGRAYVIGFGHDLTEEQAQDYLQGITTEQGLDFLDEDICNVKSACQQAFPWLVGLDDTRQDIIYEMAFQMGVKGVSGFKDMIRAILNDDWPTAAKEMLHSEWHKETPGRCEELSQLMLTGESDES